MAEKRLRFAIMTRFDKLAKEKGSTFVINKFAEQWSADALIESYGISECYDMVDYYCSVVEYPNWKSFLSSSDKVYKNLTARKEDDRIRKLMREKAKEWLRD